MIRLGTVYTVVDDETIQVRDFEDNELYEVKGSILAVDEIREAMKEDDKGEYIVEYDDETMEMEE